MTVPAKVGGYQSTVINQIIDHISQITPRTSSDIRITTTSTGTTFRLPRTLELDPTFPFKLDYANLTTPELRVYQGRWTRNSNNWRTSASLQLAVDVGESYKSITQSGSPAAVAWAANTTYVVYVALEDSTTTYDPGLNPDQISVYAVPIASYPDDTGNLTGNKFVVLGNATTNADSEFDSVGQFWYGGDIDDISYVPDTNSEYGTGSDQSVEFRDDVGQQTRNLQLRNWHSNTTIAVNTADSIVIQDVTDGANTNLLEYLNIGDLKTYIEDNFTPGGGGGEAIGDWLNTNNYIHHTDLDFADTGGGWAALGTGKSGGSTDHDDSYPHFYNDGSGINSQTFVNSKSIHTTGEMQADDFKLQDDPTNNLWNDSDMKVDASNAIYLQVASAANYINIGSLIQLKHTNEVNLDPGSNLQINGTNGWGGTFQVTQSGVTKDVTVTKGIITNVA